MYVSYYGQVRPASVSGSCADVRAKVDSGDSFDLRIRSRAKPRARCSM